jgi:hypothetical protein
MISKGFLAEKHQFAGDFSMAGRDAFALTGCDAEHREGLAKDSVSFAFVVPE